MPSRKEEGKLSGRLRDQERQEVDATIDVFLSSNDVTIPDLLKKDSRMQELRKELVAIVYDRMCDSRSKKFVYDAVNRRLWKLKVGKGNSVKWTPDMDRLADQMSTNRHGPSEIASELDVQRDAVVQRLRCRNNENGGCKGRWSKEEHAKFIRHLPRCTNSTGQVSFTALSSAVRTRTATQVAKHFDTDLVAEKLENGGVEEVDVLRALRRLGFEDESEITWNSVMPTYNVSLVRRAWKSLKIRLGVLGSTIVDDVFRAAKAKGIWTANRSSNSTSSSSTTTTTTTTTTPTTTTTAPNDDNNNDDNNVSTGEGEGEGEGVLEVEDVEEEKEKEDEKEEEKEERESDKDDENVKEHRSKSRSTDKNASDDERSSRKRSRSSSSHRRSRSKDGKRSEKRSRSSSSHRKSRSKDEKRSEKRSRSSSSSKSRRSSKEEEERKRSEGRRR